MIKLTDCTERCFAQLFGTCVVLKEKNCDGCSFYKPMDCYDWMRVRINGEMYLLTPEEYELRRQEYEQSDQN